MKKEFIGWYGGYYDDAGFYNDQEDAERGYRPNEPIYETLGEFQGKKIKITVEVLE